MGKKGYPPEFRKRALDLIKAGRKVCDVARDLGISDQTVYNWRRQDRVDRGVEDGVKMAQCPDTISLGRPVLPPVVKAFKDATNCG